VDFTPDITYLDQLVLAVRYVNKKGVPVKRFLKFIAMEGHDAEHLTNNVINILKDLKILIRNCRPKLQRQQHGRKSGP